VEDDLIGEKLLDIVGDLMRDTPRREKMSRAMKSLAHPQAADCIASLLIGLAKNSPREGC
jgi:UDP-N-acetylglucosamine:LPS N-acetylglucosamine transferase